MTGTFIETRPWTDEDFSESGPLGTTSHGITLNEPLRGWAAFSATFRVMFVEEARKSVEFAKKRQMVLFPLLLTLVTAISTIGLQFLVGETPRPRTSMRKRSRGRNFGSPCIFQCSCSHWAWGPSPSWDGTPSSPNGNEKFPARRPRSNCFRTQWPISCIS